MLLNDAQTSITARMYTKDGIAASGKDLEALSRRQLESILTAKGYRPTKEEPTQTGNVKVLYRDPLGATAVITYKRLNNGR